MNLTPVSPITLLTTPKYPDPHFNTKCDHRVIMMLKWAPFVEIFFLQVLVEGWLLVGMCLQE